MQNLITDILKKQLTEKFYQQASSSLKTDNKGAKSLVDSALPVLLKGIAKNNSKKGGAEALLAAVSKKHDGGIFDHLETLTKNPEKGEGKGILKHVLGTTEKEVEQVLAESTGTSKTDSKKIMMMLAPMVMGAIGKAQKSGKLDAKKITTLIQDLSQDQKMGNLSTNNLALKFLDKDRDGDYKDDLMQMFIAWIIKLFTGGSKR